MDEADPTCPLRIKRFPDEVLADLELDRVLLGEQERKEFRVEEPLV
ncbi:MAG: hypothetical protein ACR2KK_24255 [Acidimicrobiales bacterium]